VGLALIWSVASSLFIYPHSLSYFNELAGGPRNGHWHLINSNIDWGQDVIYFKDWRAKRADLEPMYVHFYCYYDLNAVGVGDPAPPAIPQAGWYAISVNHLHSRDGQYHWLLYDHEPDDMIGYSIYIYHITEEEAEAARRRGIGD
jgi:hypothetical protein